MLVGNGEEDALEELLYSLLFSGYLATYTAKLLIFFLIIIKLFEITAGKEVTDLVSAVVVFRKTVTQLLNKEEKPEWSPDVSGQLKSHSSNAVGLTIILSILIGIVCAKLKANILL